jgi:hypothetical protein
MPLNFLPFFFAIFGGALFVLLIFRFGLRFFNDLFNNQNRLNARDRWQIYDATRFRAVPSNQSISLEGSIFRAAYKRKGRLTISDIVLETDLSIKEAEQAINRMVDGLHVRMEVEDSGLVIYEFPEIISRFENE